MNSFYDSLEDDLDGRSTTTRRTRGASTASSRPGQKRRTSFPTKHNRPQVFNGIHRRRHKKFTW